MKSKHEHYFMISKQVFVSYFFNFLVILFQPLLIALLTRNLSIEDYGVYSLLFVTISTLSVFFRFGLAIYIKNKIPGLDYAERVKTIITLVSCSSLTLFVAGIILYLFKEFISRLLNIAGYSNLVILSILLILLIGFYEILDSYFTSIKRIFLESMLWFFIKCFWIIILFFTFFIFDKISLNLVFILWTITVAFSVLAAILSIRHEISYFFSKINKLDLIILKKALNFSLPLVLVTFFVWIISSSDRYIINHFLGKSEVAIYSLAYSLVSVIISVPVIFQNVIQPYFAEKWNLKQDVSLFFNVMLKYSLMIILPLIVGMFVLRKELITLVAGPQYLEAASIIPILLLFPLFSTLIEVLNKTLYLRDMVKHAVAIYFIAAVVNFVLNIILVPLIGISAAGYSIVVTYFTIFVFMFFFRHRTIKFKIDYLKIFELIIASLLMGAIIAPIHPIQYLSKLLVIGLGAVIYILFLFVFNIFNKQEKDLLRHIKNKIISNNH